MSKILETTMNKSITISFFYLGLRPKKIRIRADDNCNSHTHFTAKSHQLSSILVKFQLLEILMTVDDSFKHLVVCTIVVPVLAGKN